MTAEITSKKIQRGVPLAPRTTIGIGGPARYLLEAETEDELLTGVAWARAQGLPHTILGGGSNLLFDDEGFDGLVLIPAMRGIAIVEEGERAIVDIAAGEVWDDLAAWSVAQNLAGIECLSGIPGCVGAAPIQNIGAYGQELADVLEHVTAIDLEGGGIETLDRKACAFAYRDSLFKRAGRGRFIVTGIRLALTPGGVPTVRYPDLARKLGPDATLAETRAAVLEVRRGKSMVYDPDDICSHGCGSFFTNPILAEADYPGCVEKIRAAGFEDHPHWPLEDGRIKLSAAWLIERAGFGRGHGSGPIGLSDKHCLAIVNRGGGTARQVVALAHTIRARVAERFGVTLSPEPEILARKEGRAGPARGPSDLRGATGSV